MTGGNDAGFVQEGLFEPSDRARTLFYYRAYGLRVSCEFRVHELEMVAAGPVDLEVSFAEIPQRRVDVQDAPCFEFSQDEVYLGWPRFARFLITSPERVSVALEPESHESLLALPLLGPVMAILLFMRGYLVLHGSAVSKHGKGVVFLGDKEAGKSTTAAAMLAGGWALLSDDVVALDLDASPPRVFAAYPSMKLTASASAEFAPVGASMLERPFADFPKDRFRLPGTQATACEAHTAYVLERIDGPIQFAELSPPEALAAILRFSYLVRFREKLLHGSAAARHFHLCARFSRAVSVQRLQMPNSLNEVSKAPSFVSKAVGAD